MKRIVICLCLFFFSCDEEAGKPAVLYDLEISPPKATNEISVSYYSPSPNTIQVFVLNIWGQKAYELHDFSIDKPGTQKNLIDVSNYEEGVYRLGVTDNKDTLKGTFVKN